MEKRVNNSIYNLKQLLEEHIADLKAKGIMQLPSERMLSETFNCNRRTLRGALQLLDAEGVTQKLARQRLIAGQSNRDQKKQTYLLIAPTDETIHDFTLMMFQNALAMKHDCLLQVIDTFSPKEFVISRINQLIAEGVDTCFVVSNTAILAYLEQFRDKMTFYRLKADDIFRDYDTPAIMVDYQYGGYCGMQHLLESGYRRILVISVSPEHVTHTFRNFERGCKDAVTDSVEQVKLDFFFESRTELFNNTISSENIAEFAKKYDAVFACEDSRLIKLHYLLIENGISIPKNVALLGFKDTPWATALHPQLSSVSIDEKLIVNRALTMAQEGRKNIELVKPKLVVRESTGGNAKKIVQPQTDRKFDYVAI